MIAEVAKYSAAWENGDRPADEPPTPPAGEVAKAGDGDPAHCEGAAPRPAAS